MTLKALIDDSACSAHGDCVAVAPTVFALEDTAVVIGEGSDEQILAAAESCPALAITVIDTATGETIYP